MMIRRKETDREAKVTTLHPAQVVPSDVGELLKPKYGDVDSVYLRYCAEWRILRAQQQLNWAKHEYETGWGSLPDRDRDIELDTTPLFRMKELENILGDIEPQTVLGAIGICVTILSHEYPEEKLGHGPILEIVKNVLAALQHLPDEARFEPGDE
jgi:hypothetical protein